MRAFLLLATATALMLNGSASAQVGQDRWAFDVLTIWHPVRHAPRYGSTVKSEPYGVFTSQRRL